MKGVRGEGGLWAMNFDAPFNNDIKFLQRHIQNPVKHLMWSLLPK